MLPTKNLSLLEFDQNFWKFPVQYGLSMETWKIFPWNFLKFILYSPVLMIRNFQFLYNTGNSCTVGNPNNRYWSTFVFVFCITFYSLISFVCYQTLFGSFALIIRICFIYFQYSHSFSILHHHYHWNVPKLVNC